MTNKTEFRMYGFVPYNLSDIQKGIQFSHALQEYNNYIIDKILEDPKFIDSKKFSNFRKWAKEDKTVIVLDGGTTNTNKSHPGTLNKKHEMLENYIHHEEFYEIDLGDQLTAIAFLVDDRYWNFDKYPKSIIEPKRFYVTEELEEVQYDSLIKYYGEMFYGKNKKLTSVQELEIDKIIEIRNWLKAHSLA